VGVKTYSSKYYRANLILTKLEKTMNEEKRKDRERAKLERAAERSEKAAAKREYRIEKVKAAAAKALAVAKKRKYLVMLIAAAIAAYLVIFKGGSGSGMLETVKGLF